MPCSQLIVVDYDLERVFNWHEAHQVSKSPTVEYDKALYLIDDDDFSRRAIGKYIDGGHDPDGHKELGLAHCAGFEPATYCLGGNCSIH